MEISFATIQFAAKWLSFVAMRAGEALKAMRLASWAQMGGDFQIRKTWSRTCRGVEGTNASKEGRVEREDTENAKDGATEEEVEGCPTFDLAAVTIGGTVRTETEPQVLSPQPGAANTEVVEL
jgi:hypothetical protein